MKYLTMISNCGWWFVVMVFPDGSMLHYATFDNKDDAEWFGMSQPL